MKITKLETLHCDAGWRVNSFLKISTDEGVTGWSEFMEGYGAQGLATVVEKLGARLIGQDPRPVIDTGEHLRIEEDRHRPHPSQGRVVGEDHRRALHALDHGRRCEGLPTSRHSKQRLVCESFVQPFHELVDRVRLIPRGRVIGFELKWLLFHAR